ncbi:MAG: Rpn family recombination-promoting nuclease/putative transposase [Treponema sp.]|jgi:predicted transposase/invertase (TIGR01784 family)|nr:Rpn family recombination-promoting nuclease/putative transposase [Treponema sp.]
MPIRHTKDNSFKLILGNHHLFAEFLRDFIPIPVLKSVSPDDIEDLTERFLPLNQNARDSDTVKRVHLSGDNPLFVITVVEQESKVNFRTPFKMLQYISLVLDNYEKELNNRNAPFTKDFLYPPVLPIVFYDGPDQWTVKRSFRDRTALADVFGKYIPSFEYELVDLNRYRREDLIGFSDALSFIMLIDRVRTKEGVRVLESLPQKYLEKLRLKIPENLGKLMVDVITALLDRLEVPGEGIAAVTDLIEKKEYGTMFDGLVESVLRDKRQAVRAARKEAREEARREKLEGARKQKQMGVPPGIIAAGFGLSLEEIDRL